MIIIFKNPAKPSVYSNKVFEIQEIKNFLSVKIPGNRRGI
jgi:hypothetical protein